MKEAHLQTDLRGQELFALAQTALDAAGVLFHQGRVQVAHAIGPDGKLLTEHLDRNQFAAHGLAWQATYVATLKTTLDWAMRLYQTGDYGPIEEAVLSLGFAEYLAQLAGGIPMSQTEIVRPQELGVSRESIVAFLANPAVEQLLDPVSAMSARQILAGEAVEGRFGALGLDDETADAIREQFQRFTGAEVTPYAQDWHSRDQLIPLELIEKLADLGVFGLTVPEEFGGLGLGKIAMCLVSEALSQGYLGVGSLGTRAEIAAELIRSGGTPQQKDRWLPRIATGEILPTAVFTEPNAGSDLGSLQARAVREGDVYRIYGSKTWITHGSRSDLMTLLVRTDPSVEGHRGLSMLMAEKPRGTLADPFPAEGIKGSEIGVLGYRGMKEYEIAFDGFAVPATGLLGGVEGQGFKQLMATFESARIQTAARALGVAQNALELGAAYSRDRAQFGGALLRFPRVYAKLGWMAAETMMARQLTYFAARQKDAGRRCDTEAGMAKLLAARVAWANADCALQIHGGNGYATEFPISRVLCDARILSIFEGAAEIQAQVIVRGLLSRQN